MSIKNTFVDCLSTNFDTISVVSTITSDNRRGVFTISSFTSISLEPESILFCVNKKNSLSDFVNDQKLAISFLNNEQKDLSISCSSSDSQDKRLSDKGWVFEEGYIFHRKARYSLLCSVKKITEFGTHKIVICKVNKVTKLNADSKPLVYGRREYQNV
tara:strand:+ start:30 stop:503 length:474 start_codon:yes stop_codon:yes gene_type:complete